MTFKYLRKKEYISMPWKNGLGMTTEIAVEPHGSERDDSPFLWQISIAGVQENGPFSHFLNIDRHLMLLEGNGITLDGGEHGIGMLFEPLQVFNFAGDIDIVGRLSSGPITDLNLMLDRRFARGDLSGFEVAGTERITLSYQHHFIHVIDGFEGVMVDIDGEYIELMGGDCLRIDEGNRSATITQMNPKSTPTRIVFISINVIV